MSRHREVLQRLARWNSRPGRRKPKRGSPEAETLRILRLEAREFAPKDPLKDREVRTKIERLNREFGPGTFWYEFMTGPWER